MKYICRFDFVERRLSRLFAKYSSVVAQYPWIFIILPTIIACALSVGNFYKKDVKDAFYLYTPSNGQALYERNAIEEKWPVTEGRYTPSRSVSPKGECNVIVSSSDNGNILRYQFARAVIQLNQFITEEISVIVSNRRIGYRDLCLKFLKSCHINPQIYFVNQLYQTQDQGTQGDLTFPTVKYQEQNYYIANSLGGATLDPATKLVVEAKAWQLIYQLKYENAHDENMGRLWQLEFQKRLLNYKDPFIKVTVFHSLTLEIELARNADRLAPRFALCFVVLIAFAVISTLSFVWSQGYPYIDWIKSKPVIAFIGVVGAAMGVFASIGLLAFCGYEHSDLIKVMPFLVVAVRLDNTFLMISALHSIDRNIPVKERISLASGEAAVSITITVLTDILSFGCGYFTAFPAVRMFCIYTTVAIAVTFLFQLTFVLGFLVLAARLEERNCHNLIPWFKTVPSAKLGSSPLFKRLFCGGTVIEEKKVPLMKETKQLNKIIQLYYAPFLMNVYSKIATLILFLIYLATSIYGCCLLRQGLEPVKLLVDDSYAIEYYRKLEDYFWKYGVQCQVVFNEAGDLSDPNNRKEIYDILRKFAINSHATGLEGVDFWLVAFENFVQSRSGQVLNPFNGRSFYDNVRYFLSLDENARYRNDIHWRTDLITGHEIIDSFRVLIGIKNFSYALDQIETVDQFRAIAASFPQFNITTFHVMWLFVDQYEQILPNTLQEIYSGVSCMVAVALLLIPSPICSLWVALSVISIDIGVVGYMTLWGLNMDAVSMIAIIMSIGFSVDFSAHIAYSFAAADGKDPVEKTCEALASIAWPILQGGIATVMGVVVLADINSYMVAAFFKTVFLVVVLGLIHGLVFLPVVLSLFTCKFERQTKVKLNHKKINQAQIQTQRTSTEIASDRSVNLVSVIKLPYESVDNLTFFKSSKHILKSSSAIDTTRQGRSQTDNVLDIETVSRSSSLVPEDP